MAEFKSYRSYFDFWHSVTREWRYTRNSEQEAFLTAVLETSDSRKEIVPQDTILYRAQIGHDWIEVDLGMGTESEEECAFSPDRMKPLKNQASEGRANPKGIPYLYLATQLSTAISEVRPWVGALVTVAQLKVTRPLTIVDFSKEETRLMAYASEPDPKEQERAVWRDINYAFSRPVTQNEFKADYVPTQVLAEFFRKHGFDGIGYKSSLGSGINLALFDLVVTEVINCTLFQVDSVDFAFSERNRYFVTY